MQTNDWGPPQAERTNALAVGAFVCVFLFFPAAIILGHMARREIRRTGERGHGLVTAALALGYAGLALIAFLWVPAVLFAAVPHPGEVLVLFFAMVGCLIVTMITRIYRQRRRAGS